MGNFRKTIMIDLDGVLNMYDGKYEKTIADIEKFKVHWKSKKFFLPVLYISRSQDDKF